MLFLPVSANITLPDLRRLSRFGLIDGAEERRIARDWVQRLRVRTPGIDTLCLNLSGATSRRWCSPNG